jgi:hypothetical protein
MAPKARAGMEPFRVKAADHTVLSRSLRAAYST